MISKDVLRQVVARQKAGLRLEDNTVRREILDSILKWMGDNRVIILTGVRRRGKSTLLKQIIKEAKSWCYISFEDERLLDFRAQDFEIMNEVLIEEYGAAKAYFFDEVQNVEKFETFVRRLQDEGKKVVLTGSNASLLSKEFGTRLTGRYKPFEVCPFSFSEFLRFKGVSPGSLRWNILEERVMLLKLFQEYLAVGGLPEYIKNNDKDYIKTLFENILYKDIIARYSIRKEKILKELVNILAANAGTMFTYNSLKKALGLSNAITVKEYISYLNNSYLFFELLRFSHSVRQQLGFPRKAYLVDLAFNQVCGLNFTPNNGRSLENAAFIELRRGGKEVYYYAGKGECDFVVKSGIRISEAIQVCYSLDSSNRGRELNGLVEAMDEFGLKAGTILTCEQDGEIKVGEKSVIMISFARWALEKNKHAVR